MPVGEVDNREDYRSMILSIVDRLHHGANIDTIDKSSSSSITFIIDDNSTPVLDYSSNTAGIDIDRTLL